MLKMSEVKKYQLWYGVIFGWFKPCKDSVQVGKVVVSVPFIFGLKTSIDPLYIWLTVIIARSPSRLTFLDVSEELVKLLEGWNL